MSKDTIKVNMNVYDIPILVELLKKLEQENKQLKDLCNKYEEEHKTTFEIWVKGQKVLTELEEWLEMMEEKETIGTYSMVQDKIQELKEKYK